MTHLWVLTTLSSQALSWSVILPDTHLSPLPDPDQGAFITKSGQLVNNLSISPVVVTARLWGCNGSQEVLCCSSRQSARMASDGNSRSGTPCRKSQPLRVISHPQGTIGPSSSGSVAAPVAEMQRAEGYSNPISPHDSAANILAEAGGT